MRYSKNISRTKLISYFVTHLMSNCLLSSKHILCLKMHLTLLWNDAVFTVLECCMYLYIYPYLCHLFKIYYKFILSSQNSFNRR